MDGRPTPERRGGSINRGPCKHISGSGPEFVELPFVKTPCVCVGHGWGWVAGDAGLPPPTPRKQPRPAGPARPFLPEGPHPRAQTPTEAQGPRRSLHRDKRQGWGHGKQRTDDRREPAGLESTVLPPAVRQTAPTSLGWTGGRGDPARAAGRATPPSPKTSPFRLPHECE